MEPNPLQMPDTPIQHRWTQEELFTVMFSIPWVMGLIHGVGLGGLVGAVSALLPSTGVGVTTGAVAGTIGGAVLVTLLVALFTTLLPLLDPSAAGWSPWQRMLLAVSPLLAAPALVEAAVLWLRWYAQRQSWATSAGND